MSGKDSWPHGPSQDQQSSPQQQQASGGQPGPQGHPLGSHQPHNRSLPPFQTGPPQQQGPVLPPPSSLGSGGSFYNQPPHSLSLPSLGPSSHQPYSLPGIGGAPPPHGPPGPGPSMPNSGAGAGPHGPPREPHQQSHGSQASQQPQGPPAHSAIPSASPPQGSARMQTTPPSSSQGPQIPPLSSVQGQPPHAQQQQQQQGPSVSQHPLSAIPGSGPQPNGSSQHPAGVGSTGQGPSTNQQAAASQMPPSAVSGNGPAGQGPILNVGDHSGPDNISSTTGIRCLNKHTGDSNMPTSWMHFVDARSSANMRQDALSYLDQVKYQFQDHPDVYNKFLDIMKDFKSQAIDTPGVIDRVSTLFSGHPSLIQGFNTFLPPGYRIECSQDPRDTKITVTTPSGIHHATSGETVSITGNTGMPLTQAALNAAGGSGPALSRFYEQQGAQWGNADSVYGYGPGGRSSGHGNPGQQHTQPDMALDIARQQHPQPQIELQVQAAKAYFSSQAHQASVQQGVNQLQSAAAHTNGNLPKGPPSGVPPGPSTPVGDSRGAGKGPVEFNHAITYVNKIKNRFSAQPEIYKNFLEILQTYQRESKPIQDVYSQVTQLFHSAPDLLEDFKQFLPESAAQARAAAAAKAAADEAAGGVGPGGGHTPAGGAGNTRLPAVGTFAPPPTGGKETKKKRGTATAPSAQADLKVDAVSGRGSNKRPKMSQTRAPATTEQQINNVDPTLTPFRPEPLGPPAQIGASHEELQFFDRVKKFIGNKQTYNEFLKLLNLFSQGLIGKDMLVEKVHNFIGGNADIMKWFKDFVGYDKQEEIVENIPRSQNKVRLSVCRGLGPSYRLLPRMESQKPCSGRDEMCWEVLNDQWASHPTWASEDSGFVAHKKNQHEDVLHRIEEERHDYDFNIEANLRTIQLLEPIAQRIATMSPEEGAQFKLQPGLGGQSKTIYKRVIKKVYDKEKGLEVIDMLHQNPYVTVPVVLKRLKQKDEEWKAAQREWQKVWRDQTARVFWKSLDHQGIAVKQNDKKIFNTKALVNEIQAKHKEQMNRRLSATTPAPEYQFIYSFSDFDIILDACRLLAVSLEHSNVFNASDREKIDGFIKSFIPLFYGMSFRNVEDTVNSISRRTPDDDGDDGYSVPSDNHSLRGRHRGGRHDNDLLKDVLKRNKSGKQSRKEKENSSTSHSRESRESTPGTASHDQDVDMDSPSDRPVKEEGTWISKPLKHMPGLKPGMPMSPVENDHVTKRTVYTLYCNNTIYSFFRLFQILCGRLSDVKGCEEKIRQDVEIRKAPKVANELNIASSRVQDLFEDTSPTANYYLQVRAMCERFIAGEGDSTTFEEGLRSVYVEQGWKLYTVDRLCVQILKAIQSIVPSDTKEKNPEKEKNADIILRFQRDRERTEFTRGKGEYQELIGYRRNVESMLGPDDNVFRIDWHEDTKDVTIRFVPRDEVTVNDELDKDERWNYYIQTYMMCSPTEGIPLERCKRVFLKRNLPEESELPEGTNGTSPRESTGSIDSIVAEENMEVRICVNTYRLFFMPGTEDFIVQGRRHRAGKGAEHFDKVADSRKRRWREKVLPRLGWMKDAEEAAVEEHQRQWDRMVKDGADGSDDVAMGGV